jgi:UDP-N-acetylmuramate-alanine ligase
MLRLRESDVTLHLQELGATIYHGQFTFEHQGLSCGRDFTQSSYQSELIEAKEKKNPVVHRSEMLAELVAAPRHRYCRHARKNHNSS